jgi:hypothetical protein
MVTTPHTPDLTLDGKHLGPYRIIREIEHSGRGIVYLAEDTRLGRTVSLTAVPKAWTSNPERLDQLRQEARAAAALSHPAVAVIYAMEDIEGHLYLASEFVRGTTLREELQQGPLPLSEVIVVARQLADALAAAHEHGIVHRDLKPDNVLRAHDQRVKILDFGVAGTGTPAYMAPETLTGEPADARTDQYALGVMLHELASGEHPFAHGDIRKPLASVNPLALDLDRIIDRCLATSPSRRFPSSGDLADALRALPLRETPAATAPTDKAAQGAALFSPLWWWQCHQVFASIGYGAALYFLYTTRDWLPGSTGLWLLLAGGVGAVTANTFRLHLWFTSRSYPDEWATERQRAWVWTRLADLTLGATLLLAGARHVDAQPELAALFLGSAILLLIAFAVIEPASTRAATRQMGRKTRD